MRILLIISLMILSAGIRAQKPDVSDSIYFREQDRQEIEFLQCNGTQLIQAPLTQAGIGGVSVAITNGDFRRRQEAGQKTTAQLHTHGFSTMGRFKTAGYFSFSRVWEDSLSWNQKADNNYEQPYYLGSAKAGPYMRQLYKMGGLISYNLLKNKLYINGAVDYSYENTSRSQDPRLKLPKFSFLIKPEVSYKWKSSVIGIGLRFGYGDEDHSVSYQNDNYRDGAESHPEQLSYLIQGFGNIRANVTRLKKRQTYSGAELNYTTQLARWRLRMAASYSVDEEANSTPIANTARDSMLATYQLETSRLYIQLRKQTGQLQQQILATGILQNGKDYNNRSGASTYSYQHSYVQLQYLLLFTHRRKWQPELGATFLYNRDYKRDGLSNHQLEYQWMQPGLKGSVYNISVNGDKFSFSLAPSMRLPVTSELKIAPTQVTYFTRDVVYADYQYQLYRTLETNFTVQYLTRRVFKDLPAGITAQIKYTKPLDTPTPLYPALTLPGNNRLTINLGFNLYF